MTERLPGVGGYMLSVAAALTLKPVRDPDAVDFTVYCHPDRLELVRRWLDSSPFTGQDGQPRKTAAVGHPWVREDWVAVVDERKAAELGLSAAFEPQPLTVLPDPIRGGMPYGAA